jgi:hypothetical protein
MGLAPLLHQGTVLGAVSLRPGHKNGSLQHRDALPVLFGDGPHALVIA